MCQGTSFKDSMRAVQGLEDKDLDEDAFKEKCTALIHQKAEETIQKALTFASCNQLSKGSAFETFIKLQESLERKDVNVIVYPGEH